MRASGSLSLLLSISAALQTGNKPYRDENAQSRPGDLILRQGRTEQEEGKRVKSKKADTKRASSLVRTVSGENVHEPPLDVVEILHRDDHDQLPDYSDFQLFDKDEILAFMPPEVLETKEIFRMEVTPAAPVEVQIVQTSVKVSTSKRVKKTTSISQFVQATETTVVEEAPKTATLLVVPEYQLTTVVPSNPIITSAAAAGKPEGWVLFTPGIQPGPPDEKTQPTGGSQRLQERGGYLLRDDALPDAMKVIDDLWKDDVVMVTQTFYVTSKFMRTPTPTVKAAGATSSTTRLKKFEKRPKATSSTTRFHLNTGLFLNDATFTIAPNDIYRGIHAQAQNQSSPVALNTSILVAVLTFMAMLMFL